MDDDRSTIFRVGEVLSDTYEVRAILGQGGMGLVLDAQDLELMRRVAIKVNFGEVEEQFAIRTEARALAAIRHPGVVGVYALGRHRDIDFMVMEHVSGVTLARSLDRLDADAAPLEERLDVLIAIADGLAAIHRAGLAHGDIKPDNVLLAASGRVVLTDLGLVRAAYEPESGVIAGTPEYMAPEIFNGPRTGAGQFLADMYAFGVLAFRVLGGRVPYSAKTPIELLMKHAEAEVPRLADVTQVPRRLSELVSALLAKEPTDRPVSMDAVVWQLRALKQEGAQPDGPTSARSPTGGPLSVLVIDDDVDIARLVTMYVRQAAPTSEIAVAADAQQALAHFRHRSPRLVFMDLNMPGTSGFELFTYLRGVHLVDAATVVIMSAGGSEADVGLMLELGAQDFIPKGPELRARVTRIVSALADTASNRA